MAGVTRTKVDFFTGGAGQAETTHDASAELLGIQKPDAGANIRAQVTRDGQLMLGKCKLTRTGLIIPEDIELEDYQAISNAILHWDDAVQWWLGDLLGFGEWKWGTTYRKVARESGRDEKTLRNYVWVATHVDLSLRRDKLTFGHHSVIAGMTPEWQAYWLERAESEEMTIAELRKAINGDGGEKPAPMMPTEVKHDLAYLGSLSGIPFDRTAREEIRERIISARAWLDELERQL